MRIKNTIAHGGSGHGSTVEAFDRSFKMALTQTGRHMSHADVNVIQQILHEQTENLIKRLSVSGFLGKTDYVFPNTTANQMEMPAHWVVINGELLYVADPDETGEKNLITMVAPNGAREDLVFLEVWYQEVAPTASAESDNEEVPTYGGDDNTNETNDLLIASSPTIDSTKETTRRVQTRWRIRAVANADAMIDATVLAQGGKGAPEAGKTFTVDPVDAGLFIAGDGSAADGVTLDTVDGRVYAIPMAIFDRATADTNITLTDLQADIRVSTGLGATLPARVEIIPFVLGGADDANDVTTGKKVRVEMPFSGTINGWTLIADGVTSIIIDVNASTFAAFPATVTITGGAGGRPELSTEQKNSDTTLTGWTTAFTKGDIFEIEIESVLAGTKNVTLNLEVTAS